MGANTSRICCCLSVGCLPLVRGYVDYANDARLDTMAAITLEYNAGGVAFGPVVLTRCPNFDVVCGAGEPCPTWQAVDVTVSGEAGCIVQVLARYELSPWYGGPSWFYYRWRYWRPSTGTWTSWASVPYSDRGPYLIETAAVHLSLGYRPACGPLLDPVTMTIDSGDGDAYVADLPGTYRVTYLSGAVKTSVSADYWNAGGTNGKAGLFVAKWLPDQTNYWYGVTHPQAPGDWSGFPTAAQAEAASVGDTLDVVVTVPQTLLVIRTNWPEYGIPDGSIDYRIEKVA